jgi:hypothetical protein
MEGGAAVDARTPSATLDIKRALLASTARKIFSDSLNNFLRSLACSTPRLNRMLAYAKWAHQRRRPCALVKAPSPHDTGMEPSESEQAQLGTEQGQISTLTDESTRFDQTFVTIRTSRPPHGLRSNAARAAPHSARTVQPACTAPPPASSLRQWHSLLSRTSRIVLSDVAVSRGATDGLCTPRGSADQSRPKIYAQHSIRASRSGPSAAPPSARTGPRHLLAAQAAATFQRSPSHEHSKSCTYRNEP